MRNHTVTRFSCQEIFSDCFLRASLRPAVRSLGSQKLLRLSRLRGLPKPHPRPGLGLRHLFFPVFRRRGGLKRPQQTHRRTRHFIDCRLERGLVRLRRLVEPRDLPHELQRSGPHFVIRHRRFEVKQQLDISAHKISAHALRDSKMPDAPSHHRSAPDETLRPSPYPAAPPPDRSPLSPAPPLPSLLFQSSARG